MDIPSNRFMQNQVIQLVLLQVQYFAGMFPKTPNQNYSVNIINEWQPINVNVLNRTEDIYIAPVFKPCPQYGHLRTEYFNSNEFKSWFAKKNTFLEEVSIKCGEKLSSIWDAGHLYDCLKTEKNLGKV